MTVVFVKLILRGYLLVGSLFINENTELFLWVEENLLFNTDASGSDA